jgi:hypothetical protein
MITSIFHAEERVLVMLHLDEWEQLRGIGKERDADGKLYSSKDQLVDKVIQDILQSSWNETLQNSPGVNWHSHMRRETHCIL